MTSSPGNPGLFGDQARADHLLFVALRCRFRDSAVVHATLSEDRGQTRSTPEPLRVPEGMMARHLPIVRRNGYLLLPACDEKETRTAMSPAKQADAIDVQRQSCMIGNIITARHG